MLRARDAGVNRVALLGGSARSPHRHKPAVRSYTKSEIVCGKKKTHPITTRNRNRFRDPEKPPRFGNFRVVHSYVLQAKMPYSVQRSWHHTILPNKSWHVWNGWVRGKVEKDEEAAAAKAKEDRKRELEEVRTAGLRSGQHSFGSM